MKFHFEKYKYDKKLLIDCGKISETAAFTKNHQPFYVSFHEILFLTKGRGLFRLDDEKIPYQPGTILLLPPNKWRQWEIIEESPDAYFLIFEEAFIANFFQDALFLYRFHFFYNTATPSFLLTDSDCFQKMLLKLEEIRAEINDLRSDSHHLLRSILYYLLIQINRRYEQQFGLENTHFQEVTALQFRRLLEKNVRQFHLVSDYTKLLNISKSHLNKIIQKSFGKSASGMIKDRLLVEAKRELLFSDQPIAQITYQLGFSEPANFNRFFKKMTQQTPRSFRAQNVK